MGKAYELEGAIKVIDEIQKFASGFSKREFIVEVEDGKYPQMIKFECIKDKTSLTDGFKVGDQVNVSFDIRGSEYNGRYYVNLNAWKVEKAGGGGGSAPSRSNQFDDGPPPSHLSEPPGGFDDDDETSPF